MAPKPKTSSLNVETLTHDEATRKNIPTAEYQSMMRKDEQAQAVRQRCCCSSPRGRKLSSF